MCDRLKSGLKGFGDVNVERSFSKDVCGDAVGDTPGDVSEYGDTLPDASLAELPYSPSELSLLSPGVFNPFPSVDRDFRGGSGVKSESFDKDALKESRGLASIESLSAVASLREDGGSDDGDSGPVVEMEGIGKPPNVVT